MKEPQHYKEYVGQYGKRFYLSNTFDNIHKIDGFRNKVYESEIRGRKITSSVDEFHFFGESDDVWHDCEDTSIITNEYPIKDIEWVLNVSSIDYIGYNPFTQDDRDNKLKELGI